MLEGATVFDAWNFDTGGSSPRLGAFLIKGMFLIYVCVPKAWHDTCIHFTLNKTLWD